MHAREASSSWLLGEYEHTIVCTYCIIPAGDGTRESISVIVNRDIAVDITELQILQICDINTKYIHMRG